MFYLLLILVLLHPLAGQDLLVLELDDLLAVRFQITVTARRGVADIEAASPQLISVRARANWLERPSPSLGHALDGQPGVLMQQSATGQVSPFLRGLTGYHVLNLVDGIRFNNSTFRSGPNQYLAFLEPSQAQRIEAMVGPSGSLYGSDALGGVIHVLTMEPRFGGSRVETHGETGWFAASADRSSGGRAEVSLGNARIWWLAGGAGRRHGDLRAGQGFDSRNVFVRLFGFTPDQVNSLTGGRQLETGYSHSAAHTKLALRPNPQDAITFWYQFGALTSVRGYKDLLGGLGRLQSAFDPQQLHFFYARYERTQWGPLYGLAATFSVNDQQDGSRRQNLRDTDPITTEFARVRSYGYTGLGSARLWRSTMLFGGEAYDERVAAAREITGLSARPLYPDGSRHNTAAGFAHSSTDFAGPHLRLVLGGRWTAVRYRATADPRFGVAAARESFHDATFHTSLSWQAKSWFGVHVLAGRGFRAPNMNDLGAIGLNDLGYEIPARETIAAGALLGNSAGEGATSVGLPVASLQAETLFNYEAGVRLTTRRLYGRIQVFDAELKNPIVRRTLLFPADRVPSTIGQLGVTAIRPTSAQQAQGVVPVATVLDPRAVKAFVNDGESKYYGIEALARYTFSSHWSLDGNYTFLAGRDLHPNRNIRRLPPQMGAASLRYTPASRRFWIELAGTATGAQRRLSGGDIDDERIGASRRRSDIADFFRGSHVRPYLNADGRFAPTGETLRQIQDRVLPMADDSTRVPLFISTSGWLSVAVRAGVPITETLTLLMSAENVGDRNYRYHGSGIDAPGRNFHAGVRYLW